MLPSISLSHTDTGKGIPLVFIHGFPLMRDAWKKQVEGLRTTHRIIAPDLRGFGGSGMRTGPNTIELYADDVHDLLQQLATGPVILIGHSMGGYVALAFAKKYPAMLRGLVLVGTRAGADSPEAAEGRRTMAKRIRKERVQVVIDAMAPKMLSPRNTDERMAKLVRGFMSTLRPSGAIAALLAMAERPDMTDFLSSIAVPTLVITGADDVLIPPSESNILAEKIPGAELHVIPNAGHLVAFEQSAEFNTILRTWLEQFVAVVEDVVT